MAVAAVTQRREIGTRRQLGESSPEKSATRDSHHHHQCLPCGACSSCADTCCEPSCLHCEAKTNSRPVSSSSSSSSNSGGCRYYTMCQIRRHNSVESAWIVAGDDIFDATSYANSHPGGTNSILKRSGGCYDCTQDLKFHSKSGQQMWRKYYVGKVRKCPSQQQGQDCNDHDRHHCWWMFWA